MATKWKCTVCGYTHEGPGPPETCPTCGADRSQFIPVSEEKLNLLRDLYDSFVLHAVAAHFPGGLLPTTCLLFLLFLLTADSSFEQAGSYLLFITVLATPVSLASGIYDWHTRFRREKAKIFYKKIVLGIGLLLLGGLAALIRLTSPQVLAEGGTLRALFLASLLGMLFCVVLLGHYGGKLVFQWKDRGS